MRYPLVFFILALLIIAVPTERHDRHGKPSHAPAIDFMLSAHEQDNAKQWLDGRVAYLRDIPPAQQLLVMVTAIILTISAGIILAYIINSVAAILGLGVSLFILALLAIPALLGGKKSRKALGHRLTHDVAFGPFVSRLKTRAWQKRFAKAAAEHRFTRFYMNEY